VFVSDDDCAIADATGAVQARAAKSALVKLNDETDGEAWLDIQDKIREVLNQRWDPTGRQISLRTSPTGTSARSLSC
jgi:hypothetical protein